MDKDGHGFEVGKVTKPPAKPHRTTKSFGFRNCLPFELAFVGVEPPESGGVGS